MQADRFGPLGLCLALLSKSQKRQNVLVTLYCSHQDLEFCHQEPDVVTKIIDVVTKGLGVVTKSSM